jgi:hypothetical protein
VIAGRRSIVFHRQLLFRRSNEIECGRPIIASNGGVTLFKQSLILREVFTHHSPPVYEQSR